MADKSFHKYICVVLRDLISHLNQDRNRDGIITPERLLVRLKETENRTENKRLQMYIIFQEKGRNLKVIQRSSQLLLSHWAQNAWVWGESCLPLTSKGRSNTQERCVGRVFLRNPKLGPQRELCSGQCSTKQNGQGCPIIWQVDAATSVDLESKTTTSVDLQSRVLNQRGSFFSLNM